jgi:hypothetical protein
VTVRRVLLEVFLLAVVLGRLTSIRVRVRFRIRIWFPVPHVRSSGHLSGTHRDPYLLQHRYPVLSYIYHVDAHPVYVSYSYGIREGEVDAGIDKKDQGEYPIRLHFREENGLAN